MTINIKGTIMDFSSPKIMGVINFNEDSFWKGSRTTHMDELIKKALEMEENGADIIDIGFMSSKPGSKFADRVEESQSIKEVLKELRPCLKVFISIDTVYHQVAELAISNGADMINDISGGFVDDKIIDVCAGHDISYVAMHMQGIPENMQLNPQYHNVTQEILSYFYGREEYLTARGIKNIVFDPGFGFGKTLEHNYQLLSELKTFATLERPILCGLSRKSMVYKPLNTSSEFALNGTTVLNTVALMNGAHILRVHDVKEAKECVILVENILKSK